MTKLLALGVAIGVSFFCIAAAQSMPLAPLEQTQANLTIPVAGGCGPGCRNGYYGGVYFGGAVAPGVAVVPPVVVAPACRRVCNPYRCWRVC